MIYCLNPSCDRSQNPDERVFCQNCGTKLTPLLRNRYRIIQPLGGGGFGRTFLAEDEDKLNECCVVKQLAPQVQGTSALNKATELFQQEARRLQQLGEHAQIPTLYAYFREDNYLYLVQQFIEGQTLRQELKQQGTFSEEKIWELFSELLPVLKFVHQHQVIHRDIKPENIIRRSPNFTRGELPADKGNLVLIDFGVAKQLTATSLEMTGTSIGSYGYAPIEQMKHGCAYPASDLFSLGVTCFYFLTGIHPSQLYMEEGYNWVSDWRKYLKFSISTKLEQVLDKLLQKSIEQRYQSVDEVLEDLRQEPQPQPIPTPRDFSITLPPSTIDLKSEVFSSTKLQPKIQFKNQLLVGVFILLVGLLGGYEYWRSLQRIQTLTGHSDEVNTLAFNSPETTLVSGSDDKTINIWKLKNRTKIRTLRGHKGIVYSVAINADGQTLVSGSGDKTIKIWNINTNKEINTLSGHKGLVNSVAISPDGKIIASGSYDKTIKLWNLTTGQEIKTLDAYNSAVLSVAFTPTNNQLVSAGADRKISVWNLNTYTKIRTLEGHKADVNAIAISPNGDFLASVDDNKNIKVWKLNIGKEIRPLEGHLGDVNAVAFSPDGKKIATGSDDKTVKIWNLETGEEIDSLNGNSGKVYAVAFSPDGKTLVSGNENKTIKIWRINN